MIAMVRVFTDSAFKFVRSNVGAGVDLALTIVRGSVKSTVRSASEGTYSLRSLGERVRAYLRSLGQRDSSVIKAGTAAWICAPAALNGTVMRCS